jgi:hypothetical protein
VAELLASAEYELDTEFSILDATQSGPGGITGSYAISAPGVVAMLAGTKFAHLRVRLERWSGPPDSVTDEWEDEDVVPWASDPGGSPLEVWGFEPAAG